MVVAANLGIAVIVSNSLYVGRLVDWNGTCCWAKISALQNNGCKYCPRFNRLSKMRNIHFQHKITYTSDTTKLRSSQFFVVVGTH